MRKVSVGEEGRRRPNGKKEKSESNAKQLDEKRGKGA